MSNLQQEVYETLRDQLLAGRFQPGQKLRELPLAAELGVKRNPVREALFKLAREGLLKREAGLGCRVAKVDVELFREAWQLRESIEGMAARLAAERIQPVQLIRIENHLELMRRLMKPGHNSDFNEADNAFHLMLLELSGNKVLREVWRQYLVRIVDMQVMLMPVSYSPPLANHERTLSGHALIVDALRAHDPDATERAARHHIASCLGELMSMWSEQQQQKQQEQKDTKNAG